MRLQTGPAALKHVQFVSNFSFQADHCAEQNLSRHNDSERLIAIMLKILNFKKNGKESKFILLEQQGPASSLPLTSHLHLLKKPGKQVDRVLESYWDYECEKKIAFLFLSNCRKSKFLRKSEVLAHNITGGHYWRKGCEHQEYRLPLQKPRPESTVVRHTPPINPGSTFRKTKGHTFEADLYLKERNLTATSQPSG